MIDSSSFFKLVLCKWYNYFLGGPVWNTRPHAPRIICWHCGMYLNIEQGHCSLINCIIFVCTKILRLQIKSCSCLKLNNTVSDEQNQFGKQIVFPDVPTLGQSSNFSLAEKLKSLSLQDGTQNGIIFRPTHPIAIVCQSPFSATAH